MNENEIKNLQDSIIEKLGVKLEMEMDSKIKSGFKWVVILMTSLATLFLAFVTLSLSNMINLFSFKEEVKVTISEMKNQDKALSDNLKTIPFFKTDLPVDL